MRRRDLIVMLAGVATVPCRLVSAQQHAQPLVAFLNPRISEINLGAFRRGLRELGYVEGQNIALEVRSAEGDNRRLPALAAELAGLKPDVVVTSGEPATRAIKEAAGTIPIVMAIVDDPVALGFAQSLARPGGNLTGLTILATGVLGKRLQMLYETVPNPGCVAVLGVAGERASRDAQRLRGLRSGEQWAIHLGHVRRPKRRVRAVGVLPRTVDVEVAQADELHAVAAEEDVGELLVHRLRERVW